MANFSSLAVALAGLLAIMDVVYSQTTVDVSSCSDLPESVTEDTVLQFTSSPVSCDVNTKVDVLNGATVTLASVNDVTKLNNIRFYLKEASTFISSVPSLEWTSVELKSGIAGAALKVSRTCSATFEEEVTFTGCYTRDEYESPGGAVVNWGTLSFEKAVNFLETLEFEGDALFKDNQHLNRYGPTDEQFNDDISVGDDDYTSYTSTTDDYFFDDVVFSDDFPFSDDDYAYTTDDYSPTTFTDDYSYTTDDGFTSTSTDDDYRYTTTADDDSSTSEITDGGADGAGLINGEEGSVHFKGSATFINNLVAERKSFEAEGIMYLGGQGAGVYSRGFAGDIRFSGPVVFQDNKARAGSAMFLSGEQKIVFEDSVTFENGECTSIGDESLAGAVFVSSYNEVEFNAEVIATGNVAKTGGAFYISAETNVTFTGPLTITDNEARYQAGAIWSLSTSLVMPADAVIERNTAIACPGIYNSDGDAYDPFDNYRPAAELELGGSKTVGYSKDLCYLGETDLPMSTQLDASSSCASVIASASMFGDYPYVVMDTREVSTWDLTDFSCDTQLTIFVTGGGELTVTASADSTTVENVRFEVLAYSKLTIVAPEIILTGISRSAIGGTMYVERGSSMDVMAKIYFMGNTLAYLSDSAWIERGGAAMYTAGDVIFHERAYFLGNGQYEQDGFEVWNQPGGAIVNIGSLEFMKKATFNDNFALNGGNGGGIANGGTLVFNLRAIFRNNTVEESYTDDGETYNGHGPGLYNLGGSATVLFKRLAIFKDNVGSFRGCALAVNGGTERDSNIGAGLNSVVFEQTAKFKDNLCNGGGVYGTNDTGGAALWVYGESTVSFEDTAVFKRNIANNGAAIMNAGTINFVSADKIVMTDNVAGQTCSAINNYDKDLGDHEQSELGDINDPDGTCSHGDPCTWYEGEVNIGDTSYVGVSDEICDEIP